MSARQLAFAVAASLFLATGAQAALVVNGDFEDDLPPPGINGAGYALQVPPGWAFSGANPVVFTSVYNTTVDPFGNQAFQLERNADTISQVISGLTANTPYSLTFELSTFGTYGNPSQLTVGLTNSNQLSSLITTSTTSWLSQTITFTPTSSSLTLSFANTGATNVSYPQLDNIAISPVPEAGQWAMLISGLGLVGLVARRRKKA